MSDSLNSASPESKTPQFRGGLLNTIVNKIRDRPWLIWLGLIIVFSFILDMYTLTQYPISYGPDGPYYDIQVRNILRTGFPNSNDSPLIYYYLVPFVLLFGNSFVGIKVGMATIGSLIAIPAFLLTEEFNEKWDIGSKAPALLAAFLITVNVYYFRMIEDFMQNLFGIFFLLFLLFFLVRLYENVDDWRRNGILTVFFLVLTILSHIYVAFIAIGLFFMGFFFSIVVKTIKARTIPRQDIKVTAILVVISFMILIPLFIIFPSILTNFSKLESFLNALFIDSFNGIVQTAQAIQIIPLQRSPSVRLDFIVFLTMPTLLGVAALLVYLIRGVRSKKTDTSETLIPRSAAISWIYLILIVLLFGLCLPFIPANWRSRFVLLSFVPIALIVPVGLKLVEKVMHNKYQIKKQVRQMVIILVALTFVFVSFLSVLSAIPEMGPVITMEQYDELERIRETYIPNQVDTDGVLYVAGGSTVGLPYWVEYILDMEVETGTFTDAVENHPGKSIYLLTQIRQVDAPFKGNLPTIWNPFFPLIDNPAAITDYKTSLAYESPTRSIGIEQQQPPGNIGLVIFHGLYFELSLIFDQEGNSFIES